MKISIKSIKQIITAYLPAIVWAGLIFILSNQQILPGFELSVLDFIFKKTAHICVYAVLYFLLFMANKKTWPKNQNFNARLWLLPLALSLVYAISDELHQSTVPGRHATIRDISYDMLGASLVLIAKLGYI